MTPDESALLSHIGTLIYYGIVVLIVDCTLYGFYLLAEFIALYLFFKHGLKQRIQKILFVTSVTTLTTATWDFVNQCSYNLIQIKVSLMEPLEAGLQAQADAAQKAILPWFTMMVWPISINIIIGNGVLLWRAWAVCESDRSLRSAFITMGFVNAALCLADAIVDTIIRSKGVKSGNSSLDTAQMFISLAINIVATTCIGLKAKQNPDLVKDYFAQFKSRRERFEKMVLVLMESGVVLLIFQLLYAIFGRLNVTAAQFSNINIAWSVIATMFNAITILYAMAVIIMVIIDRSALDKLFGLKTTINVSTSEKTGQTTKISTLRFAEGGRQVTSNTSSTGLGSDIEAQDDSVSDVNVAGAVTEKTRSEIVVAQ
ncbi:hypothetical protein BDP27DRAFT_1420901 [Rhodocollybia butyracea]|uniref:Uncharacterized protein n=1 Tax=Rhodocollybia butyracea TaxID=206335 RepID=A0A9P5U837_9AGAR|nr:hypothetical protein BDP27DRAFT_1420901 [Rhodocollybia butyracea]